MIANNHIKHKQNNALKLLFYVTEFMKCKILNNIQFI